MEAELFDPDEIQSRLQRTLCETLRGRSQEVAASMASAYRPGKTLLVMRFEYHRSMYFNAFAQSRRGRHVVGIDIAAVVLLQVLFQRLLSSADFLPELPEVDRAIGGWEVPFVNDVGRVQSIRACRSGWTTTAVSSHSSSKIFVVRSC